MKKPSLSRRRNKPGRSHARRFKSLRAVQGKIKQIRHPARYVVYEQPGPGWRLFLNISGDTFTPNDWTRATLFKQERIARLIAKAYPRSRWQSRRLHVARVMLQVPGHRRARLRR